MEAGQRVTDRIDQLIALFNRRSLDLPDGRISRRLDRLADLTYPTDPTDPTHPTYCETESSSIWSAARTNISSGNAPMISIVSLTIVLGTPVTR